MMDQQQSQQQLLPVHHQQTDMTTTTPPVVVKPATGTPPTVSSASHLNALEEFAIGIFSGVFGAFLSWFQLTGLEFVFYVILIPSLLLEIWESYVLFHKATTISCEIAYAVAHIQAVSRKRLARQLFGQGVIMGSAGFEIIQPDFDLNDALLSRVTYYAIAWLIWIVICHFLNTFPPEDKIANQVKKQRALVRASSSTTSTTTTSVRHHHKKNNNKNHHHNHHRRSSTTTNSTSKKIRRTKSGSHSSSSFSSNMSTSSRRGHRTSSSSIRRSKSIDKTHVAIDLP